MREILSLEHDLGTPSGCSQSWHWRQRRGATDVVDQQVIKFLGKDLVLLRVFPGFSQLIQSGDECLGDEPPTIGAKPSIDGNFGARCVCHDCGDPTG